MVEIAKALARNPRILILDEATSALTAADVGKVFVVLKRLRQEGLALIFISHRMGEIEELADDCTVFRNGSNVATYPAGSKTDDEIVEMMIGREYSHVFPPKPADQRRRRSAAARGQAPELGRPAARRLVQRPVGRGGRARRTRRAGAARTPARPVRRAARSLRRDSASRASRSPRKARTPRSPRAAWR